MGDTFWGLVSRDLAADDIPKAQPNMKTTPITDSNEVDILLSRYISRQGIGDALVAWNSMGGRIYPTARALDVRNAVSKGEGLPLVTEDSDSEPDSGLVPKVALEPRKLRKPKKTAGHRFLEALKPRITKAGSIKRMSKRSRPFRGLPTTLVPKSNSGAEAGESLQWDIDCGPEARRLRLKHYREAAERTWRNHLEERRKIELRTPEYDSEESIDKTLDTQMESGVRPRKMPRCHLDTNAVIYEFSSSEDEKDRRIKRARLAERCPDKDHPAVCRDVGVMGVVIPKHPLRVFSAPVPDRTLPPESGPTGLNSQRTLSDNPELQPEAPVPRPSGKKPYLRKPVEEPGESERQLDKELGKPPNEQPRLKMPGTTPEPEPGTYHSEPTTPEPAILSPKAKNARKKPGGRGNSLQAKVTEGLSEQAFMAAKRSGRVFCCACGALLRALKVAVSVNDPFLVLCL